MRTTYFTLPVLLASLGAVSACDRSTGRDAGGGSSGDDISDVIFDMEGGDEALLAILAESVKEDPAQAAVIDAPVADAIVDPATPFTFRWHVGQADARSAPSRHFYRTFEPPRSPDALERAIGFIFDVREAHAHGPAVNGRAYFLVLKTDGDDKLMRVFTQATEYTPGADAWQRVVDAGAPITATILSADMESNRVLQGGGPWLSAPVTFTVAPN